MINKALKITLICATIFLHNNALAAAPSFRVDKLYPELGLTMRVLGNSQPEMLPQFKTFTYTVTRGEESFKQNRFDPQELWYATQHGGGWLDNAGNTLVIGQATKQLPQFAEPHVVREVFEAALQAAENQVEAETPASYSAWVESFAGAKPGEPVKLRTSSNFSLHDALFMPNPDSQRLIYLFRVKVHTPAGRRVPSNWYCAVLHLADADDSQKARSNFESQFLTKVAAAPRSYTNTQNAGRANELLPSRSSASSPEIPDSPSRVAARKSIGNMKEWWFAETPEYIFLSDVRSSTGRSLVREMQQNMPHLRGAYAKLIPPFEPLTDANVVRIFETQEGYKQYVGESLEWSSGLWSPMQRELVILSQGRDHAKTIEIIQHEGFHQYLFFATSMITSPPWYNEGHACFFEAAQIDRQGAVKIPENSRVQHLLSNLDAAAKHIPALLTMDYDVFYSKAEEQRSLNYTTAWALIYYLRKGAPLERSNPYAQILDKYLAALKASKNGTNATTEAFYNIDTKKLQEDFTGFWMRQRNKGRLYDPFK
ncbi:MAG: DUF1570 domain-containing protein [Kiritimatiellae bacterium]|nr:DUF1570 domain-containing protein [Kiritimatiellia bacterium]